MMMIIQYTWYTVLSVCPAIHLSGPSDVVVSYWSSVGSMPSVGVVWFTGGFTGFFRLSISQYMSRHRSP